MDLENPQNDFENPQTNLILMLSYIPLFLISSRHSINQLICISMFHSISTPFFPILKITTLLFCLMCDLHQQLVSPTQIQRHDLVLVVRRGHLPRRCARVARSSEPPQRHNKLQPLKDVTGRISTYIYIFVHIHLHVYQHTYYIHMYVDRICCIVYCT